jgi:hypothetical protein
MSRVVALVCGRGLEGLRRVEERIVGDRVRPAPAPPRADERVESPRRHESVAMSGQALDYLFGQSAEEAERLRLQAKMFAPYTARFVEDAGISRGMKVLDVGTGAGDVALLVADLVAEEGNCRRRRSQPGVDSDGSSPGRGRGAWECFVRRSAMRLRSSPTATSMRSSVGACCSLPRIPPRWCAG